MAGDANAEIVDLLRQLNMATTSEKVIELFMGFIRPKGFTSFLIAQLANPNRPEADKAMAFTNWPVELLEDRFNKGGMLHDPVVRYGLRSRFHFSWSTAYEFASRYGQEKMLEARDFRLNDGFMFPMRRPGAPLGGVSIGAERLDISPLELSDIQLAAMHCYSRLEALHPPYDHGENRPALSPFEQDVIQFAASGKTAWEISAIMGVSEDAAKNAIKRVRAKLNAMNTAHAVANAIAQEIIVP